MHALRTNSQTSNKQENSARLDVMYTAAPGETTLKFLCRAQHTAPTTPRFVVLIQLCLWVDEILGETHNPLYFLSFFSKNSILQGLIAMYYV